MGSTRPPFLIILQCILLASAPLFYGYALYFRPVQFIDFLENSGFSTELPMNLRTWTFLLVSSLSGVFLILPRKLLWFLSLAGNVALVVYVGEHGENPTPFVLQPLLWLPLMTIFFIVFYFRDPYIDRRDRWTYINHRYEMHIPVMIKNFDKAARLVNISRGGAAVEWGRPSDKPAIGQIVEVSFGEFRAAAQVIYDTGKVCGVSFIQLSSQAKTHLHALIAKARAENAPKQKNK